MANFIITGPNTNFISFGDSYNIAERVIDVSSILKHQLPEFIKEDYPKFVAFIEAYYEWLEIKGQPVFESKKTLEYTDIDRTIDEFIEYFRKEFMVDIPQNIVADKRNLLKNIKQFYRAKGTERSYRLLFRILYDKDVDFYYPREDILKTSDGKWVQEQSMKVRIISGNAYDLVSKRITGETSGATAIIENVVQYSSAAYTVYELFISKNSVFGTFTPGENILYNIPDTVDQIKAEIYPVITGVELFEQSTQKNLWLSSEPLDASSFWGTANILFQDSTRLGFAGGEVVYPDNSVTRELRHAGVTLGLVPGSTYRLSFYIKMDDGSVPNSGTGNYRDFTLTINNSDVINHNAINIEPYRDDIYRVSYTFTFQASSSIYIRKYTINSPKGFTVSGFQVEAGSETTAYQPVGSAFEVYELGGLNYESDREVFFYDTNGSGAKGKIKVVDRKGKIKFVEIQNSGVAYSEDTEVVFPTNDTPAFGRVQLGAIFTYPGYFLNEDGQLSTTKFLQDSYFYQQFSYVVLVDESIDKFKDILKKILHPCGLIMFGGVQFIDLSNVQAKIINRTNSNHNTYRLEFLFFIRAIMNSGTSFPVRQKNLYTLYSYLRKKDSSFGFGPSYASLEKNLFSYLPTPYHPGENALVPAPNLNYWEQYGNTQVKDLEHLNVHDFIDNKWKRVNLLPDPYIIFRKNTGAINYSLIDTSADYDFDQAVTIAEEIIDVPNLKSASLSLNREDSPLITNATEQENLFDSSIDLTDDSITKTNVTASSDEIANPIDGTLDVSLLTEDSSTNEKSISVSNIRWIDGKQFVFDGYAKTNGRNWLKITFDPSAKANASVIYNVNTRSVYKGSGVDYANITVDTDFPSGWIKFTCAFTPSTNVSGDITLNISNSKTSLSYTGDGSSGMYLWKMHLRRADSNQTYIETTGVKKLAGYGTKKVGYFDGSNSLVSSFQKNYWDNSEPIASTNYDYSSGMTYRYSTSLFPIWKNSLQRTEDFANAYWSKVNCSITTDGTLSPNGIDLAQKMVENSINAQHYFAKSSIPVQSGYAYTLSIYAKKGSGDRYFIYGYGGAVAVYDLETGEVTSSDGASYLSSGMDPVGGGWYRCYITATMPLSTVSCFMGMTNDPNDVGSFNAYQGNGASYIYLWGVQLEIGAAVTTYKKVVSDTAHGEVVFGDNSIYRQIGQSVNQIVAGKKYTFSFYARRLDGQPFHTTGTTYRDFTITVNNADQPYNANTYKAQSLGNGVYRFSFTYTATGNPGVYLRKYNGLNTAVEFIATGFQFEESTEATAYQRMTGATTSSGLVLDDYIDDDVSTVYLVFEPYHAGQTNGILLEDSNSKYKIYIDSGSLKVSLDDGSVKTISNNIVSAKKYILKVSHYNGVLYVSLNGGSDKFMVLSDISNVSGALTIGENFIGKIARIILDDDYYDLSNDYLILNYLQLTYRF